MEKGAQEVLFLRNVVYIINDDENKHHFAFLKLSAKCRNEKE